MSKSISHRPVTSSDLKQDRSFFRRSVVLQPVTKMLRTIDKCIPGLVLFDATDIQCCSSYAKTLNHTHVHVERHK